MSAGSEVTILSCVIEPDKPELPPDMARRQRMHELLDKAKAGTITAEEQAKVDNYERVGHFISLLKAKAYASLQPPPRSH